jgi:hypothetical protein
MENKVKALDKLYRRLVKDRLNKIFEENNFGQRILDITVDYSGMSQDDMFDDENYDDVINYQLFNIDIMINGQFSETDLWEVSNIFLNVSDYVITDPYALMLNYYDVDDNNRHSDLTFHSDGQRVTDENSIHNILNKQTSHFF